MVHREDKHSLGPIPLHPQQGCQNLESGSHGLHCHMVIANISPAPIISKQEDNHSICGLSAADPPATSSSMIKKLPLILFVHLVLPLYTNW